MAKKKTKAQLKRLMQRAATRGEVYVPPSVDESQETPPVVSQEPTSKKNDKDADSSVAVKKLSAARKLQQDLQAIEKNEALKAKDRRSAKRKAEAIATEASGLSSADELLAWYLLQKRDDADEDVSEKNKSKNSKPKQKNTIPYIVFVGQLSFDTTNEGLFARIQKELGAEHKVTAETVQIRVLTDPKTKKSRGMAFVQVSNPELLHALLKLHHTFLEGRRLNVEKSAGGGRNSEVRKSKLQHFRQEQDKYMETAVMAMIAEFQQRGEIQENLQDEKLDEGVVALCQRHSATVVQAALERYVESNGRDMDNPSAYLSFLLTKLAEEGIMDEETRRENKKKMKGGQRQQQRPQKRSRY